MRRRLKRRAASAVCSADVDGFFMDMDPLP
jgi:hypothetical protein